MSKIFALTTVGTQPICLLLSHMVMRFLKVIQLQREFYSLLLLMIFLHDLDVKSRCKLFQCFEASKNDVTKSIPVIFLSAHATSQSVRGLRQGACYTYNLLISKSSLRE